MAERYPQTSGPLFEAVQRLRIFPDSKTFPDSRPTSDPELIERLFAAMLETFVAEHFELPAAPAAPAAPPNAGRQPIEAHIDSLWDSLTRPPDAEPPPHSTRIPLPHAYVVPGGRFRESYYWDTYFTAEGLAASGRADLVESMVRNFADLIDRFGHIPNGNRTYYLSRSQPPFFCSMLELLERALGFDAVAPFVPRLVAEHRFWMDGAGPGAHRRAVTLPGGEVLNRYWDDRDAPREESFREDVELFERAGADRRPGLYRNIRAAAESGWDFSSRWLTPDAEGRWPLERIRTTEILPVDLNCLLHGAESRLAEWLARLGDPRAAAYAEAAGRRREAIRRHFWDEERGWFFDYCWTEGARTDVWSLAGAYPLLLGLADERQAAVAAEQIRGRFLRPGGLVTTLAETGQQWDSPNGWAPLQWVAARGLARYGHAELAREVAQRFTDVARQVFEQTGKMMEKYDVCDPSRPGGGGEYPLQDGFGWTNGVVRAFIEEYDLL